MFIRLFLSYLILITYPVLGCGDFLLLGKDSLVCGRSMEFSIDLKSEVSIHPRGEFVQSSASNGQKGISWTSKYGYLSLIGLGLDKPLDGLNEKGLSFAALWLESSIYPTEHDPLKTIDLEDIGTWILGNFATVEELKKELPHIQIWAHPTEKLGFTALLHFAIHDADGNSLAIEFLKGKMVVVENPTHILTNDPSLDWHLENLNKFSNLSPSDQAKMPGDWSPASRFIRLFYLKKHLHNSTSCQDLICQASHLLNTMDIPIGAVITHPSYPSFFTQWAVIKDLKNKQILIRGHNQLAYTTYDLTKALAEDSPPIRKTL